MELRTGVCTESARLVFAAGHFRSVACDCEHLPAAMVGLHFIPFDRLFLHRLILTSGGP